MSDTDRSDPHPDSPPAERPEQPDRRSVEGVEEPESPLDGTGIEDGVGGTGGVNELLTESSTPAPSSAAR